MTGLEQKIATIVAEVAEMDEASVVVSESLADLGIDSLMSVEIAVDVERAFGLRFDETELKEVRSFRSLVEITRRRLDAEQAA
jgi:acyl carrier protein